MATSALAGGTKSVAPAPRRTLREEARVELGRRLFFDPRVSRAGMRSCADCHDPAHGYSDREQVSADDRGPTRRHSQTIVDAVDNPSFHWDGAFHRIEDLVTGRITLSQKDVASYGHALAGSASRAGLSTLARGPDRGIEGPSSALAPAGNTGIPEGKVERSGQLPGDYPSSDPQGESGYVGDGLYGALPAPPPAPAEPAPDPTSPPPCYRREPAGASSGEGRGDPAATPEPAESAPVTSPSAPSAGPVAPTPPGDAKAPIPAAAPAAPVAGRDPAAGPRAGDAPVDDPFAPSGLAHGEQGLAYLAPEFEIEKLPLADQALAEAGRYREAFVAAFGSPEITVARVADAIAQYCRTVRSGTSAYDRFVAGDASALSLDARRGLELFRGRAGCAQCHSMTGERATFTDRQFHDTGVSWNGIVAKDDVERLALADRADLGAGDISGSPRQRRMFRTPTLRDVARRGPFMHDGSARTLAAAVRHYDRGTTDPQADARLPKVDLDNLETASLVAFLRALTSDERPGLAASAWRERAPRTKLRFVDGAGTPLVDFQVKLAAAGEGLPGLDRNDTDGWTARTDDAGWIAFEPPLSTHVRVILPDGLRLDDGALVPDTCREAVIAVPVEGRVHVLVTMPVGVAAPRTMVAEHVEALIFPDRRVPRTVLRREGVTQVGGRAVAVYGAPARTDVPSRVALHLPLKTWGMDRLRVTLDPEKTTKLDLGK